MRYCRFDCPNLLSLCLLSTWWHQLLTTAIHRLGGVQQACYKKRISSSWWLPLKLQEMYSCTSKAESCLPHQTVKLSIWAPFLGCPRILLVSPKHDNCLATLFAEAISNFPSDIFSNTAEIALLIAELSQFISVVLAVFVQCTSWC